MSASQTGTRPEWSDSERVFIHLGGWLADLADRRQHHPLNTSFEQAFSACSLEGDAWSTHWSTIAARLATRETRAETGARIVGGEAAVNAFRTLMRAFEETERVA